MSIQSMIKCVAFGESKMGSIKKTLLIFWVIALFVLMAGVSFAGHPGHNACNPCAKNTCNPCNPCYKHKAKNSCNPCNPCGGADKISFFRDHKFSNLKEAIFYGERLASDPSLGNSGKSCDKCHKGGRSFKKSIKRSYPHYVKIAEDVVTLDQMINFCMVNHLKTKPLSYGSREMSALAAYTMAVYPQEYAANFGHNPCAINEGNPCAKNACNPCAKNACNPCAKNACNPCAKNACNPCAK